ncbi:hypothetical protein BKA62DRAFT_720363 [Auriculariales sp. MPI-PUGE-AT-0066]|nr:hypothetical protein BKA62DRAFT_720363 [Auriculariales sp. MPI-PUGE-AT-0066]
MTIGAYSGQERLAFGIDLGTTMSAVTFAHLEDGEEPRIRLVTRWPGQEDAAGDCKVPSIVRYNSVGQAVQFGTEAVENPDGLENTTVAKWFKLHLHPAAMRAENHLTPPALPHNVTLKTVYADFLGYLFTHSRKFLESSTLDATGGGSLWTRLQSNFVICLAIPNGWEDAQQAFLRDAVVAAGILPYNHDRESLQFVSESESSVHFAVMYASISNWLREGTLLGVLDAGGSTVDTTIYRCVSCAPLLRLEEVTSSECVQAGSAFVDQEAEKYLQNKLRGSRYGTPETIAAMVRAFERKTKRKFDGSNDQSIIQFGQDYDNDRPRVSRGRVTLTSNEVRSLFEWPVEAITSSVNNVLQRAEGHCKMILMVGGFAESLFLQSVLRERLASNNVRLISIDEATKKAAAEGALTWYAKQFVVARAARSTFGIETYMPYDARQPDHRARTTWVDADGSTRVSGGFSTLVKKNTVVQSHASSKSPFHKLYSNFPTALATFEVDLLTIDSLAPGKWYLGPNGIALPQFRNVCTVSADLSGLENSLRSMNGIHGRQYWRVDFEVEIFFGQTSLCAKLVWNEGVSAPALPT